MGDLSGDKRLDLDEALFLVFVKGIQDDSGKTIPFLGSLACFNQVENLPGIGECK